MELQKTLLERDARSMLCIWSSRKRSEAARVEIWHVMVAAASGVSLVARKSGYPKQINQQIRNGMTPREKEL